MNRKKRGRKLSFFCWKPTSKLDFCYNERDHKSKNYVQLFDTIEQNGVALEVTPYFLINVSGDGEGFSMWSPTPCDVLATDWVEVHD